jgi:riboflavin biosynthesis pyrimidine reductase
MDRDALTELYAPPAGRPWLRANFVTSLDGADTVDSYSRGLSSPADQLVLRTLRMQCDALMVGAGTLRHERYGPLRLSERRRRWRREHGLAEHPTLVVVSGRGLLTRSNPALALAPVRPTVITRGAAAVDRRKAIASVADVITAGREEVDLAEALALLHGRGLRQILCEGGAQLLGTLIAGNLVDELCLSVAPLLTGGGPAGRIARGPRSPVREMRLRHALLADGYLLLRYARP